MIHSQIIPLILGLSVLWGMTAGCQRQSPPPQASPRAANERPALAALGAAPGNAIVAQGQLQPSSGVIAIVAAPGDRLESLEVAEEQTVKAGESLGRLASQAAREAELAVAEVKLQEARQRIAAEERLAQAKLEVAQVGLRQAQLEVQQAKQEFAIAQASGGRLDLLDQQVALGESKLTQLRSASGDPTAGRLVTDSTLDQQQLAVNQARSDLRSARAQAESAIASGELAVEAAEQELEAAQVAIESNKASASLDSAAEQINLLKLQVKASQLLSPIDGTVIDIEILPGEPTGPRPLMYLADLTRMVCVVEVNVAQLPRIHVGSRASITSPVFEQPLSGQVKSISRMVGSPELPSPNPMARVDYRSTEVVIDIDPKDVPRAAEFINLQVDVAIADEK